jgi:excisionase family DNA binding protein
MDLARNEIPLSVSHQSVVNKNAAPQTTHKFATPALNPKQNRSNCNEAIFENFITKEELAHLFKVSISFVEKLMADGGLPYFKIGRSVRFRYEEVREWLLRRRFP